MVTGKGFRVPEEGTIGQGSQLFRAQQVSSKTSSCMESRVVKTSQVREIHFETMLSGMVEGKGRH